MAMGSPRMLHDVTLEERVRRVVHVIEVALSTSLLTRSSKVTL